MSYAHGAWAEAVAAAWLVEQGYEVFTGLSGQESCDMIALRRGETGLIRVEVKYGVRVPSGKLLINVRNWDAFDTLLVVSPEGVVHQDPGSDICNGAEPTSGRRGVTVPWNKGTKGVSGGGRPRRIEGNHR